MVCQKQVDVAIDENSNVHGDSLYGRGIAAAENGDSESAIRLFETLIARGEISTGVYTNLGLQYIKTEQLKAAEASFNKSLASNPRDYVASNNLGVVKRKQGEFHKAEQFYQQSIESNPDYANAHHNIGILYDLYMHDLQNALQHYSRYQAINNNSDKLVAKWIVDLERRITAENR